MFVDNLILCIPFGRYHVHLSEGEQRPTVAPAFYPITVTVFQPTITIGLIMVNADRNKLNKKLPEGTLHVGALGSLV